MCKLERGVCRGAVSRDMRDGAAQARLASSLVDRASRYYAASARAAPTRPLATRKAA
jgi:hypothetical protein